MKHWLYPGTSYLFPFLEIYPTSLIKAKQISATPNDRGTKIKKILEEGMKVFF